MSSRPSSARRLAASLLAALSISSASSASPAPAGSVLVVDPLGPPGTHATIQAAIDAAVDGDVILVKPGVYATFLIDDLSVDLVADAGSAVHVTGGARVVNLSAGKRVLLSGLDLSGLASTTLFGGHGLNLIANAGAVRVQSCQLLGADNVDQPSDCTGFGDQSGWEGAVVSQCQDVVFSSCTLTAGRGVHQKDSTGCYKATPGGEGGHGLSATTSSVALYDCELWAGAGGRGGWGGDGGHGYRASGGALFASGCSLFGGAGGIGIDWLYGPGGDGGHGLDMSSDAAATLHDCTLAGGPGGMSFLFPDGVPGSPYSGGTPAQLSGAARDFTSPVPVREGNTLQLVFEGEPFDFAYVLAGQGDFFAFLPAFHGVLLAAYPIVFPMGALGAGGAGTVGYPLGPLPPSVLAAKVPLQAVFFGADLQVFLGPPRHQVILDSSF